MSEGVTCVVECLFPFETSDVRSLQSGNVLKTLIHCHEDCKAETQIYKTFRSLLLKLMINREILNRERNENKNQLGQGRCHENIGSKENFLRI